MKLFGRAKEADDRNDRAVPKQRVDVKIKGVGRTAGVVEEFHGEAVVIALIVSADAEALALHEPPAILEFSTKRGLFRQHGHAHFSVAGPDTLAFVPEGEPEHVQRRDFVRVPANMPVVITAENSRIPVEYDALNISANGILLSPPFSTAVRLRPGMAVWLAIPMKDGKEPITPRGTVVRDAGAGMVGVRFDHIKETHQERLARFVAKREREDRRNGEI